MEEGDVWRKVGAGQVNPSTAPSTSMAENCGITYTVQPALPCPAVQHACLGYPPKEPMVPIAPNRFHRPTLANLYSYPGPTYWGSAAELVFPYYKPINTTSMYVRCCNLT